MESRFDRPTKVEYLVTLTSIFAQAVHLLHIYGVIS